MKYQNVAHGGARPDGRSGDRAMHSVVRRIGGRNSHPEFHRVLANDRAFNGEGADRASPSVSWFGSRRGAEDAESMIVICSQFLPCKGRGTIRRMVEGCHQA
ncbi:hypothetical protein ASF14_16450 [Sphingomonas sp. Leaf257]|nr:hypothetical protein ASF14_16450 [Sphingomonas sp. Leaf257]